MSDTQSAPPTSTKRDIGMTGHDTRVSRADIADMDGILELQAANQTARGGALAASLTGERLAKMMQDMPLIVARRDGRITGFLLTTSREVNADIPIVKAMFNAYHGAPDAYVYVRSVSGKRNAARAWRK